MHGVQIEAHKKRGQKGPLHGLQGLVLVQMGEVLYTANTAGKAGAILCRSASCLLVALKEKKEGMMRFRHAMTAAKGVPQLACVAQGLLVALPCCHRSVFHAFVLPV